jgi:acetolactate synthase I/II/III large subunit
VNRHGPSERVTVGELAARLLEGAGVGHLFGVISIHNMPVLDAVGRRGAVRFVAARGEAGAANMADGYARAGGGLGVVVTSTGAGAGNAAGAMGEAQSAGTPLLHLTGQIDYEYLDRNAGYIHEASDQLGLLRAVSKAAFRIRTPETALGTLREAVRLALTPPRGPVSVEIPIDIQKMEVDLPDAAEFKVPASALLQPDPEQLDAASRLLVGAKRPLLWLGSGARDATGAARRFARMGWAVVTSVAGRGIFPEDEPMSLGAFGGAHPVEALYERCDALIVAGSRLRASDTLLYALSLPQPRVLIDVDELARNRSYTFDRFLCADARLTLEALADRLEGNAAIDPAFPAEVKAARAKAEEDLRARLGPHADLVAALEQRFDETSVWVRDVTISNNSWGNRLPALVTPRQGMYAVGGGIGQGLPMAIGAAFAAKKHDRVYALVGDGGLAVTIGELGTLVQEALPVTLVVMNDGGYGVIRNIQDKEYGGRRYFVDVAPPDLGALARAYGLESRRIESVAAFADAIDWGRSIGGPVLLDVDMAKIGAFAQAFAGPPARKRT